MKRLISWIGFTIGFTFIVAIVGTSVWRLASPLFIDRTVDEPLPFELPLPTFATATPQFPAEEEIGVILPPTTTVIITGTISGTISGAISESIKVTVTEIVTATPTVTPIVTGTVAGTEVITMTATITETTEASSTASQTNSANILGQGTFVDGDAIHKGSGLATLYHAPDGSYLLRFDDFATTNGPDVRVLLSPNATPTDHDSLGEYLDLGEIKGNIGDQNYPLPADFDPTLYKSVVIHCLAFRVIFATATLE
jgi:Electron transfer DM13